LSSGSDVSFIEDICLASLALSLRENKLIVAKMNWHHHVHHCCMKIYFMSSIRCPWGHSISYWIYFPQAEVECKVCQNGWIPTHFHQNYAPLYYLIFSWRLIS
jgi:hypothetical protein